MALEHHLNFRENAVVADLLVDTCDTSINFMRTVEWVLWSSVLVDAEAP